MTTKNTPLKILPFRFLLAQEQMMEWIIDTFGKPQEVEGEPGEFKTYEFTDRLENFPIPFGSDQVSGELANILTVGLWNNHLVKESVLKGPPLLIKSVEFEAPYYPVWPPKKSYNPLF